MDLIFHSCLFLLFIYDDTPGAFFKRYSYASIRPGFFKALRCDEIHGGEGDSDMHAIMLPRLCIFGIVFIIKAQIKKIKCLRVLNRRLTRSKYSRLASPHYVDGSITTRRR